MRGITRTIKRRVGDFVLELGSDGVRMRRFGCAKDGAQQASFPELAKLLGVQSAKNRVESFDHPVGAWQPAAGDPVWLDPNVTGYSRGVVISILPAAPEPMFLVRMARGKTRAFERKNLRPAPARRKDNEPLPLEQIAAGQNSA